MESEADPDEEERNRPGRKILFDSPTPQSSRKITGPQTRDSGLAYGREAELVFVIVQ